jgi:ABC-type Mn2+/Zn2+ transport system ATPase subunit
VYACPLPELKAKKISMITLDCDEVQKFWDELLIMKMTVLASNGMKRFN